MATITNQTEIQDLGWLVPIGYAVDGTVRFTCKPIRKQPGNTPMETLLVGTRFEANDGTRWIVTGCYQPVQDDTHGGMVYVIGCIPDTTPDASSHHTYITNPERALRDHTGLNWKWEHTGGGCLALVHGDMFGDDGTYAMVTYEEGPLNWHDEEHGINTEWAIAVGIYPAGECEPFEFYIYDNWADMLAHHDFKATTK